MTLDQNSTAEDLPTQSDREQDRKRIEKALADFLSSGGSIYQVESNQRSSPPTFIINAEKAAHLKSGAASVLAADVKVQTPAKALNDTELSRLLRAHCTAGASLASAATTLNQTRKRCEAIARRYQIPFRSAAFSDARARS
ncbi:hypothetical protein [Pseudomonas syringae group sp. J309-1]|uniref:hypothetical protein n=1 Tax=Pseudomonas syringae group sp. J309-1 TaxID=3079588 RepID=UPI00290F0A20|nr:hypothetical protein [Pseudomonas syringae group sp. J309-1]MDU8358508.1 hypothetical protein [Pseudomonas syringae group sp. J309-1]